jgi:hypothetical protein
MNESDCQLNIIMMDKVRKPRFISVSIETIQRLSHVAHELESPMTAKFDW